jgi:hypothetical protein
MPQFNDGVPTLLDDETGTAWCWDADRLVRVDTRLAGEIEACYAALAIAREIALSYEVEACYAAHGTLHQVQACYEIEADNVGLDARREVDDDLIRQQYRSVRRVCIDGRLPVVREQLLVA